MRARWIWLCTAALGACGGEHPTEAEAYAAVAAAACDDVTITVETAGALWQGARGPASCAAEARSCEAFEACREASGACDEDACDGETLVRCVDGQEVREDCEAGCVLTAAGPVCVDREQPCETPRCLDAATLLECVEGTAVREVDCADRLGGGVCAVQDGAAGCTPTAAECPDGRTECDGLDGRVCYRGVWVDFRCSDLPGFVCQVPEPGVLRCIPE